VFVGAGNPMNDFVTDDKQPKKVARTMMLMTRDLNAKLGAELGKAAADVTQVQCVTCHRGVAIPRQLADIVVATATANGAPAAATQYRELRKQYYGAQAYDFREDSLLAAAQRLTQANRPDEALALLNLNLEFFPMGARSHQAMSQAYQRKNDRENAIKSLQRAIELDPGNAQYKNQLTQLQMPPAN
jgi:tetratricopeptide (TPR) repeat protein